MYSILFWKLFKVLTAIVDSWLISLMDIICMPWNMCVIKQWFHVHVKKQLIIAVSHPDLKNVVFLLYSPVQMCPSFWGGIGIWIKISVVHLYLSVCLSDTFLGMLHSYGASVNIAPCSHLTVLYVCLSVHMKHPRNFQVHCIEISFWAE